MQTLLLWRILVQASVLLADHLVVFVLALLLVGTTPIGTGAGVHQFDLVHPRFSHTHVLNGRVVSHEQLAQASALPPRATRPTGEGLAIGSGTSGDPLDSGAAWSPTVPFQVTSLVLEPLWAWPTVELTLPAGRFEAPPDPPPIPSTQV